MFIFAGVALLLTLLSSSLESEESFKAAVECLQSPVAKFALWLVLAGLIYHSVAGVRHLVMDLGIGETLEGGLLGAKITVVVSAVLIIAAGVWIL
ncbi:Succinate dehydrogenase cytochrome b556 subunit [Sinobacterium norvegicum]|uniref:Succinate dehydrogenase cytochrome b556 subunit n=1 Tax=Sinobacterium norvegicum TaxID=1641715 RepID=A0ABN8EDG4_9GAMM|nr:Succinate dehydrogenase cytochrome b556 subunit [Sinobacterium norvegicum]